MSSDVPDKCGEEMESCQPPPTKKVKMDTSASLLPTTALPVNSGQNSVPIIITSPSYVVPAISQNPGPPSNFIGGINLTISNGRVIANNGSSTTSTSSGVTSSKHSIATSTTSNVPAPPPLQFMSPSVIRMTGNVAALNLSTQPTLNTGQAVVVQNAPFLIPLAAARAPVNNQLCTLRLAPTAQNSQTDAKVSIGETPKPKRLPQESTKSFRYNKIRPSVPVKIAPASQKLKEPSLSPATSTGSSVNMFTKRSSSDSPSLSSSNLIGNSKEANIPSSGDITCNNDSCIDTNSSNSSISGSDSLSCVKTNNINVHESDISSLRNDTKVSSFKRQTPTPPPQLIDSKQTKLKKLKLSQSKTAKAPTEEKSSSRFDFVLVKIDPKILTNPLQPISDILPNVTFTPASQAITQAALSYNDSSVLNKPFEPIEKAPCSSAATTKLANIACNDRNNNNSPQYDAPSDPITCNNSKISSPDILHQCRVQDEESQMNHDIADVKKCLNENSLIDPLQKSTTNVHSLTDAEVDVSLKCSEVLLSSPADASGLREAGQVGANSGVVDGDDPMSLMQWEDGIGSLPGSDLRFRLNEFGVYEMIMDEPGEVSERPDISTQDEPYNITQETKQENDDDARRDNQIHVLKQESDDKAWCNVTADEYSIVNATTSTSNVINQETNESALTKEATISLNVTEYQDKVQTEITNTDNLEADKLFTNPNIDTKDLSDPAFEEAWKLGLEPSIEKTSGCKKNSRQNSEIPPGDSVSMNDTTLESDSPELDVAGTVSSHDIHSDQDVTEDVSLECTENLTDDNQTIKKEPDDSSPDVKQESSQHRQALRKSNRPPMVKDLLTKRRKKGLASDRRASGFHWTLYLEQECASGAPISLFKEAFPKVRNSLKIGMKLEGVSPHNQSLYCVLTVAETRGYRVRLHIDDTSDTYDFWRNADSPYLFPVGWCEKNGKTLQPPKGYSDSGEFNWGYYLRDNPAQIVQKYQLTHNAISHVTPSSFRVGQRLEAVDKKNSALTCVASVADTIGDLILIHFDGWETTYDYWCDITSPYIHPIGWCEQQGIPLVQPADWNEEFYWDLYLKKCQATAVPARAFKPRQHVGFEPNMKVEVVDKRNPILIRVATIAAVMNYRVKIHFDGWDAIYDYWLDDDSPDIHPPGWCLRTGHPLMSPLTPADLVVDPGEPGCPTPGCKGIGHIKGAKFTGHHSSFGCPYSRMNLLKETESVTSETAGMMSPTAVNCDTDVSSPRASQTIIDDQDAAKYGNENIDTATAANTSAETTSPNDVKSPEPVVAKSKRGRKPKSFLHWREKKEKEEKERENIRKMHLGIHQSIFMGTVSPNEPAQNMPFGWEEHTKLLPAVNRYDGNDVSTWNVEQVAAFIRTLLGSRDYAQMFRDQQIDGEAFLLLHQNDLVNIMKLKLGPAVKVYSSVVMLKTSVT